MSDIELISYKEYLSDQYTKAICTICLDNKYLVSYGKKLGKDGQVWWKAASFQVDTGGGVKAYVDSFEMDSNKAKEQILEFIRNADKAHGSKSALNSGVAETSALPF